MPSSRDAVFNGRVDFRDAIFEQHVTFNYATFGAVALFHSTIFKEVAHVSDSTFSADLSLIGGTFCADTDFSGAKFAADADFRFVTFSADSGFKYCGASTPSARNILSPYPAVWLLFAVLYTQAGFTPEPPKLPIETFPAMIEEFRTGRPLEFKRALTYSLAVTSLQKPDPKPVTNWAHALVTLETILDPYKPRCSRSPFDASSCAESNRLYSPFSIAPSTR